MKAKNHPLTKLHSSLESDMHSPPDTRLSLYLVTIKRDEGVRATRILESRDTEIYTWRIRNKRLLVMYLTAKLPDPAKLPRSENLRDPTTTTHSKINSRAMVLEFCLEVL